MTKIENSAKSYKSKVFDKTKIALDDLAMLYDIQLDPDKLIPNKIFGSEIDEQIRIYGSIYDEGFNRIIEG